MFSIFRNKPKSDQLTDMSEVRCDMHSHLIPGIDDGAADMEMALQMIRGMHELGYQKLITTPHVMWEMYKNTNAIIRAGCKAVQARLDQEKIPVEFHAAAEYFLDEHFDELLQSEEPLLTLKDNLVLVEFSFIRQPVELKEMLFKLQIKGYLPVVAHPERYLYFSKNKNWYDEIKEQGCLFQLNLLSLCGFYGKKQLELSEYLIKKKYVDLVGTDLHNIRHLLIIKSSHSIMGSIKRLLDSGMLQNPNL